MRGKGERTKIMKNSPLKTTNNHHPHPSSIHGLLDGLVFGELVLFSTMNNDIIL
jgi:hypothetical protein